MVVLRNKAISAFGGSTASVLESNSLSYTAQTSRVICDLVKVQEQLGYLLYAIFYWVDPRSAYCRILLYNYMAISLYIYITIYLYDYMTI